MGSRPLKHMSTGLSEKQSAGAPVPETGATNDLQSNLRRLDQLANLGLVSASIAHEIKNGLVAINTFVGVLLEKESDHELAQMVMRELKRIDSLATQMLRLSSPKPTVFASVSLHETLEHSLRLLEHQFKSRLIAVQTDFRAGNDRVRGDESQLQQAFMNLLLNAAEAMGNHGQLWVATELFGERRLKIFIRDTGPGIATENLTRLFEPFFTTKRHGTGLGLAICQRVAEEHLGNIEVKSEPGHGSTFIITLPVE